MTTDPADIPRPKTSSRDPQRLHADLRRWLTRVLPDGAEPALGELGVPSGNGMSSETLLFDATWNHEGAPRTSSLVARVAPDPAAAPVFAAYHLDRQFRTIQQVGALTSVPVPGLRWLETDHSALGAPFFVMDRVDGVVPADLPPYALTGWVADGTPGQRQRLQDESVQVLDWEMAAVAPPEVDLAWMAFMHFFFESMLGKHGLGGLPEMLKPEDLAMTYAMLSGYEPRDLPFYLTYNAIRYAIVMFRIGRRQLLFGEMELPADLDDMTGIRDELEALLAGGSPLTGAC